MVTDLIFLLGLGLTLAGLAWFSVPVAMIVAGLGCLVVALSRRRHGQTR